MSELKYIEVMWAEQAPDIYTGPRFDEHRPDWQVNEAGSGDVDRGGQDLCQLKADCFPAGTKIVISVPLCPRCGESSDLGHFAKEQKCDCGFDWYKWTEEKYS